MSDDSKRFIPRVEYYATYDRLADSFSPLFPARNDNVAMRSFELGLSDLPKGLNPDDMELWHIGTFHDTLHERGFFADMYLVQGVKLDEEE